MKVIYLSLQYLDALSKIDIKAAYRMSFFFSKTHSWLDAIQCGQDMSGVSIKTCKKDSPGGALSRTFGIY